MPSTRDIRRRIKSVKNTRQITKAMELVAASKMKKAQQTAINGLPYANLLADVLASLASRIEETSHPFLVQRPVRTRGILLITTDKGLCGPLNANLFKLVSEIHTPVKYYSIGRKGTQFLARTKRAMVAEFQVHDRVPFAEVSRLGPGLTYEARARLAFWSRPAMFSDQHRTGMAALTPGMARSLASILSAGRPPPSNSAGPPDGITMI